MFSLQQAKRSSDLSAQRFLQKCQSKKTEPKYNDVRTFVDNNAALNLSQRYVRRRGHIKANRGLTYVTFVVNAILVLKAHCIVVLEIDAL